MNECNPALHSNASRCMCCCVFIWFHWEIKNLLLLSRSQSTPPPTPIPCHVTLMEQSRAWHTPACVMILKYSVKWMKRVWICSCSLCKPTAAVDVARRFCTDHNKKKNNVCSIRWSIRWFNSLSEETYSTLHLVSGHCCFCGSIHAHRERIGI